MQYLEIGGTEYPLHFGAAALNQFCKKFNIDRVGTLFNMAIEGLPRTADGQIVTSQEQAAQIGSFDIPFSMEQIANIIRFGINDGYRKEVREGRRAAGSYQEISEEQAFDFMDTEEGLAFEAYAAFLVSAMSQFVPSQKKSSGGEEESSLDELTFDQLQAFACGQAGMREDDFWGAELKEIFNRINGHSLAEQARQRSDWERTRWQSALILNMFTKKGKRLKATDLATFPWEEGYRAVSRQQVTYTREEREQRFGKADKVIAKLIQQRKEAAPNG